QPTGVAPPEQQQHRQKVHRIAAPHDLHQRVVALNVCTDDVLQQDPGQCEGGHQGHRTPLVRDHSVPSSHTVALDSRSGTVLAAPAGASSPSMDSRSFASFSTLGPLSKSATANWTHSALCTRLRNSIAI